MWKWIPQTQSMVATFGLNVDRPQRDGVTIDPRKDVGQQGGCFASNTWMMALAKSQKRGLTTHRRTPQRHSASLTCRVFCALLNSPRLSHGDPHLARTLLLLSLL